MKGARAALVQAISAVGPHLLLSPKGLLLRDSQGERALGLGEAMVPNLTELLRTRLFSCERPAASRYGNRTSGDPVLVSALAAAASGATYWEPGWKVSKSGDEWAFLTDGKLTLFVDDRTQLLPVGAGLGEDVSVLLPCARENLSPGYFTLVSRAGPIDASVPHVQVFLNLAAQAAPFLAEAMMTRAAAERFRYEARFVNDSALYRRLDTATIHVEPDSYPSLLALLLGLRRSHPGWLREGTPLFTREVSVGVAVAEAPRSGGRTPADYGRYCCRLLAEAMLASLRAAEPFGALWVERITRHFQEAGMSVEKPHVRELKASRTRKALEVRSRR